jgi:phosphopantetheinyl transferase
MTRLVLPERWRACAAVAEMPEVSLEPFTEEELAVAAGLHPDKRRREWLASRFLAKELASELGLGACTIASAGTRPLLLAGGRECQERLSLSHSGRYAAAAIATVPVGIDIQVPRDVNPRVTHLFLTDEEEAALKRCAIEDALLHFWCSKEAAWKAASDVYATLKQTPLRMIGVLADGLVLEGVGLTVETARLAEDLIGALAYSRHPEPPAMISLLG